MKKASICLLILCVLGLAMSCQQPNQEKATFEVTVTNNSSVVITYIEMAYSGLYGFGRYVKDDEPLAAGVSRSFKMNPDFEGTVKVIAATVDYTAKYSAGVSAAFSFNGSSLTAQ